MKAGLTLLFLLISPYIICQNTVGTILNNAGSYNGYTLVGPLNSTETYLINNCGEVVNQWSSNFRPGASVYLLENGNLLRTGRVANPSINFGGVGGKIELFDWDGNLLWEYTHASATFIQHHDIYPLPNGNVLMLSAEVITGFDAIAGGRNPELLQQGEVYNEQILELEPVGINQANIVWEWNFKDHLIQDFDASKNNFGNVGDNPQRLDFNYINSTVGQANWLHINSIQYSETLDQIILSSRILSEIYIIDHSTTTAEAASSIGGIYGKGGDLLYRWGNPESYRHGTSANKQLFGQHYPHRIAEGLQDAGKILVFNNTSGGTSSSVDIINPPESAPGVYEYNPVLGYGPAAAEWQFTTPNPSDLFSPILSSAQRLPNGNTLICEGNSGSFLEIDTDGTIVWEYINPDSSTGIITQGNQPSLNQVFRALRFGPDYPAFAGRDLTPGEPIELNPDLSNCSILGLDSVVLNDLSFYPNPTNGFITLKSNQVANKIEVYNIVGSKLVETLNSNKLDLTNYNSGIYLVKIYLGDRSITKKVVKR